MPDPKNPGKPAPQPEPEEEWEEVEEEEEEEMEETPAPAPEKPKSAATPAAVPPAAPADSKAKAAASATVPLKADAPKGPTDPTKMPKILFVAGMVLFMLASCSFKSHQHWEMRYKCLSSYYRGDSIAPSEPLEPYRMRSAEMDPAKAKEENEKFAEEYKKAKEEFDKGDKVKKFMAAARDHDEWVHDHKDDAALAAKKAARAEQALGDWAITRFYAAQLGLLLMIVGLALLMINGSIYEAIAALIVMGIGVLPALTGGLGHWLGPMMR